MKKFLLGTVGLIALGATSAMAADLPARTYTKAPPAPIYAVYNWTGFYIGGHVGYGWGDKTWSSAAAAPLVEAAHSTDGFLGGLQAGFNYQINQVVFGIEGDVSWTNMSGTSACTTFAAACSSDLRWMGTVTGRLGYAFNNALLYGKGGVAFADDRYFHTAPATASETKTGWTLGVGLEYAFAQNWTGKVEYNYMDFGTDRVVFNNGDIADIKQTANVVKFGINYKFGGPIVAKY